MYAAGRASLAFLPSWWNVLTATAFLFPKTTTGSCSAYFNPKKTLLSHFRLALHYYERTPLPPQFLSCVNTETHCIQISLFSAPSLDGLGVVSVLDFVLWSQQEAGEWEQVAEQRTDCACHSLCWGESHQSFLTWNHSNVGLGEIWFRLSLFTTADFCVVLKTPVQKFHSFLLGSLV